MVTFGYYFKINIFFSLLFQSVTPKKTFVTLVGVTTDELGTCDIGSEKSPLDKLIFWSKFWVMVGKSNFRLFTPIN